jgi:hypothetical protein
MKTLFTTLLLTSAIWCAGQTKDGIRYFEYGCRFSLNNGCVSTSQTTVKIHGAISFDQMKLNISKWVYPLKLKDFHIWYLKEIKSGEMYVYTEKFNCKQLKWTGIDNQDTIKNTNNFITFSSNSK